MSVCACMCNSCARVCSFMCRFGKKRRNELQMPDGVVKWIANWAATLGSRPDTMEIAKTSKKQLEHQVPRFFFFLKMECACLNVRARWGTCITDEYHAGWCEALSSWGAQGEMQHSCWETLQSYLPSCLPARRRPSLSTSLFPLSECAPIFRHHHFSALFYPVPSTLPSTLIASLRSIFPLHPL